MRYHKLILAFLLISATLVVAAQTKAAQPGTFTIEGDHFLLNGKPFKVISGELHYARIPREYWRQRLRMARAMGLNTVATYVFWNVHEPEPGVYDFSGNADLAAFVRMAQEEGLFVLLRAGPYSCAEWDLGGFPAWLLKTPEGQKALRSNDEIFMQSAERWLLRLGKEVAALQIGRGGPILATQIENEYGNFVSEYWPGWFDHWGHPHETRPLAPQLEDLEYILKRGTGINIYMFHGGTSFGFMSGSSLTRDQFLPDVTSYDYDAPLDEAGHPTLKYFGYRELLAKYSGSPLPPVPEVSPVVAVADFALDQSSPLWDNLPQQIKSEDPHSMEKFGQSFGYILYRTQVTGPQSGELELEEVHDYARVYLDGALVGTVDRRLGQGHLSLTTTGPSSRLDILVENSGRINSTGTMRTETKGITRQVRLAGKPLTGWQVFCLPMNSVKDIHYSSKSDTESGPGFFRGSFQIDRIGDVFLDVHNLGKGALWINGHAIGRFWNIGRQQALFGPGPWLRRGKNEIVVFDLFGKQGTTLPHLAGLTKPILDASTKDAKGSKQE